MRLDASVIPPSNRVRMTTDCNTSLLVLQDRDMNVQRIERSLAELPNERATTQGKIDGYTAEIEAGRQRVKEMEVRGKSIEAEIAEVENQALKYKNQQLLVKKNEEYQALTHEIESTEKKTSELEEQEIELLYELDEARKTQGESEVEWNEKIDAEKRFLGRLDEKESQLNSEIDAARAALAQVKGEIDPPSLSVYQRVSRGLKFPIIVALRDSKCEGCHMRVSASVEVETRKGTEITTCDNCGRILYWDA